jgi:hypothetical protein
MSNHLFSYGVSFDIHWSYGEGTEILREMFFWPRAPHLPELMAVHKAEFLTLGSARNRKC